MNLQLPHWAQVVIACVILVTTYLLQQNAEGSFVLPVALVAVLTVVNTVLGILSPSARSGGPGAGKGMGSSSSKGDGKTPGAYSRTTLLAFAAALMIGVTGCQQVQAAFPVLDKIEQVVVADLTAGKTLEQIEADVANLVAGQAGVDVVVVLNDVLTILVDTGVIPPGIIPQAKAMQAKVATQLAARGK